MSTLDGRITALEREVEALKAVRVRSSAEMVTTTKTTTIYPVVHGAKISTPGQPDQNVVVNDKRGCVDIVLEDTGFVSVAMSSGYSGRKFYQYILAQDGQHWTYKFEIYSGTASDNSYCNGDYTKKLTIPMGLEITATSDFTMTVYQE